MVCHIRTNVYLGDFYQETYTFYDEDGKTYWTRAHRLRKQRLSTDVERRIHMNVGGEKVDYPSRDNTNSEISFASTIFYQYSYLY